MKSAWALVGGKPMHARVALDEAPPDAPDLVLVHGVGVSSRYMVPAILQFAPACRVHAPDLPGFGRSIKPARVLTIPELSDALAEWMDAMGLARAAFLGNSFGCQVVVDFAIRHPDKVSHAILQGPTVDPEARTWGQQVARWLRDGPLEPPSLSTVLLRDYMDCGTRRLLQTYKHALENPLAQKLPRVQCLTLVVRGSRDPIVPQQWAETATRLLPRGRLAVVPGPAHALNYAAPLELSRVVLPFLHEKAVPHPRNGEAEAVGVAAAMATRADARPNEDAQRGLSLYPPEQEGGPQRGRLEGRWAIVDGLPMYYVASCGPTRRDRPVVVLVHGMGVASGYLCPTAALLARDHPVRVPDLPGYGLSEDPGRILSLAELADALKRWMDAIGLDRAALLGNSFGCQIVAEFATRYPARVEKAILQGPTRDPHHPGALEQIRRWRTNKGREPPNMRRIARRDYRDAGVARMARTFKLMLDDPIERKLPRIRAQTLVVGGTIDPITPVAWVEEAADLLPRGRCKIITDAPHTSVFFNALELSRVVIPFLQAETPEASRQKGGEHVENPHEIA